MKALFTFVFVSILFAGISQSDCKPYVPPTKGSTWEITNYSKKDKVTGKIKYELLDLVESGNDITFKLQATSYDDKDEVVYVNEYEAYCTGGKFEFDMDLMMNGASMAAYQEMDVEVDASKFVIPTYAEPAGTKLADGELTIKIGSGGTTMFTMKVLVTDRLIEGTERRETSAGDFDCIVLTQKVTTRVLFKIEASSKEWYSEKVGLVRSESYDKKGKLTGYSVLTSITSK
jgi:hypothetical protein